MEELYLQLMDSSVIRPGKWHRLLYIDELTELVLINLRISYGEVLREVLYLISRIFRILIFNYYEDRIIVKSPVYPKESSFYLVIFKRIRAGCRSLSVLY
jgi:hypothetical protein